MAPNDRPAARLGSPTPHPASGTSRPRLAFNFDEGDHGRVRTLVDAGNDPPG